MVDVCKDTNLRCSVKFISREENKFLTTYIADVVSMLLQFCQLFRTDNRHF